MSAGADPMVPDNDSMLPIELAVPAGNLVIVAELLVARAYGSKALLRFAQFAQFAQKAGQSIVHVQRPRASAARQSLKQENIQRQDSIAKLCSELGTLSARDLFSEMCAKTVIRNVSEYRCITKIFYFLNATSDEKLSCGSPPELRLEYLGLILDRVKRQGEHKIDGTTMNWKISCKSSLRRARASHAIWRPPQSAGQIFRDLSLAVTR
jgi:hypothetical protein